MKKRLLCALMALVCAVSLGGCARVEVSPPASGTLPPAENLYEAPRGASGMTYQGQAALHLPSRDGQRLLAQYEALELSRASDNAEAIVRALLSHPSTEEVSALGGGVNITLYGVRPVEVSGGVCTVNLSASALQLEKRQFYTLCMALASTLCELDGILHVNVLVADQPVGLDVVSALPMGAVTSHPGEDLPALWEQQIAKGTPLGDDISATPLTAAATLYFPLSDGSGFMPETRNLSFPGQSPAQLASSLLAALSSGAQYIQGACAMPDLNAMLASDITVSSLPSGSQLVTLSFIGDFTQRLNLQGIDPACMMGAVVYTLTTFIPSVSAVRFLSGGMEISTVSHSRLGLMAFQDGMQRRNQYAGALMERVVIYLASGGRLKAVYRTVNCQSAADPFTLMALLMAGPTRQEAEAGLTMVFPVGLEEKDVLGVGAHGDTLLINLSERFGQMIQQQTVDEQLLCYAMVVTLCQAQALRKVRFFFAGDMLESLGGSLYWAGEFLYNDALVDQLQG